MSRRAKLIIVGIALTPAAFAAHGCGALQLERTVFPDQVANTDGELIYIEDLQAIVDDPDLLDFEVRLDLNGLGIENQDLIDALIAGGLDKVYGAHHILGMVGGTLILIHPIILALRWVNASGWALDHMLLFHGEWDIDFGAAAYWAKQRGKKTVLGGMSSADYQWLDIICRAGVTRYIDEIGRASCRERV